jgi:hypothetical protein
MRRDYVKCVDEFRVQEFGDVILGEGLRHVSRRVLSTKYVKYEV